MPLIDIVELWDDLWFGAPTWFPPYVETSESDLPGFSPFADSPQQHPLDALEERSSRRPTQDGVAPVATAARGMSFSGWWHNTFGDRRRSTAEKPSLLSGSRRSSVIGEEESDPCSTLSPPHSGDDKDRRSSLEPVIGTWGHRQTNYTLAASVEENPGRPADSAPAESSSNGGTEGRPPSEELDKKLSEKAWEWRFRQRWAKEHMYDPNAAVDNNEEDGLTFMHKHGAHGWQQQFEIRDGQSSGRSSRKQREVERGGSQDMFFGPLQTPDATPDMRSTLLRENSIDNGGEATKKIEQLAQQAKELILRQEQIDEQVTQRWAACKSTGQPWVGQKLPVHKFDMWGEMPFFLLKVEDSNGHHKFLVRAKKAINTEQKAHSSVQQELQRAATGSRLPVHDVSITVLGGGKMTWNHDSSVRLSQGAGSSGWSNIDVANLVASLLDHEVAVQLDRGQHAVASRA